MIITVSPALGISEVVFNHFRTETLSALLAEAFLSGVFHDLLFSSQILLYAVLLRTLCIIQY